MHPFEDLVVDDASVGIHWFGQSSIGLKSPAGTIVQIDPYFPRLRPADRFIHARPPLDEFTLRTDAVLLTHNHGDHTCSESIVRIRASFPDVRFVGPHESATHLAAAGVEAEVFTTVTAGDQVAVGDFTVHAVWAKPPEGLAADGIKPPDVTHLGYVVDSGAVRLYISGDPVNTFAEHEKLLAPIRALAPHIGFLTNHPSEGEFPYFAGSAKTAVELGLQTVVPTHYQCFVSRNYDPQEWAAQLPADGPSPLLIPYNQSTVYTP